MSAMHLLLAPCGSATPWMALLSRSQFPRGATLGMLTPLNDDLQTEKICRKAHLAIFLELVDGGQGLLVRELGLHACNARRGRIASQRS